jgi:hypothetical protein
MRARVGGRHESPEPILGPTIPALGRALWPSESQNPQLVADLKAEAEKRSQEIARNRRPPGSVP